MFVYLIRCSDTRFYKVGVATDFSRRISAIQTDNPFPIYAVCIISSDNDIAYEIEHKLHSYLELNQVQGEWFNLSGGEVTKLVGRMKKSGRLVFEEKNRPNAG